MRKGESLKVLRANSPNINPHHVWSCELRGGVNFRIYQEIMTLQTLRNKKQPRSSTVISYTSRTNNMSVTTPGYLLSCDPHPHLSTTERQPFQLPSQELLQEGLGQHFRSV